MKKWQIACLVVIAFFAGVIADKIVPDIAESMRGHRSRTARAVAPTRSTAGYVDSNGMPLDAPLSMTIDTLGEVIAYYPHFTRIDLVCGMKPSEGDLDVLLTTEAAFTGNNHEKEFFRQSDIAGNHVSGGAFYLGYNCPINTGTFVWKRGSWKFLEGTGLLALADVSDNQGMGFNQILFIHKGERQHCNITATRYYRTLCERGGRLCIIASRHKMAFFDYVVTLLRLGVKEAMYLNSGGGYLHDNSGNLIRLHDNGQTWGTNWLTFYR